MSRAARLLGIAFVALALTGCAPYGSSVGTGTAWSVSVKHPFPSQNVSGCADDPAVDFAIMSADLPSSGTSLNLHPESTAADAQRVAGCLFASLWSGTISVRSPA